MAKLRLNSAFRLFCKDGRRFIVLLAAGIFFAGAGSLFAGGGQASGGSSDKPVNLTVWMGSWWADGVPKIVEAYKKAAPNVNLTIETLPINGYFDNAATTILGGGGPDLLAIDAYMMGTFFEKGLLRPWDDKIKNLDLDDFAGVKNAGIYQGKRYGIPYRASGSILYYNKTLFDKAGVSYPQEGWTWDDLRSIAQKLTVPSEQQYGYGIAAGQKDTGNVFEVLNPVVWAFGGDYLNKDQTQANLTDPNTIKAVRFWSDLYLKDKVVPPGSINYSITADVMPLFIGNKVAMLISGDQANSEFSKYPDLKFGFTVLPKGPTGTGGYMWTVPVTAKNPDAAFAFALWFLEPENLGNLTVRIPARVSATKYGAWNTPVYQTILKGALSGRLNPTIPQWAEMQKIITVELQNILQGAKTVEQAMEDANRQCNALLK
ncbi:sugar ABC transporter substrate-binding protein [Spirochaetia bacterium]|nr:sugar ABC transporter substrate-binding protein [Spirochaetia bacterium]